MVLEVLFGVVVVVALPVRAWRRHRRGAPPAPPQEYILQTLLLTAGLATLLYRGRVSPRAIGLDLQLSSAFFFDVFLCFGLVVGLDAWWTARGLRQIRRQPALRRPGGASAEALAAGREPLPFLAVTTVGAIWEELCFRATVFLLVPRTPLGLATGILLGSVIFGAQHLRNGVRGMAHISGFGVMFAVLYLATDNLVAVIVAHAAGNLITGMVWAPRIEQAMQSARRATIFLG